MLKIRNIIQYAIIVLCASALFASCIKEEVPSVGDKQYTMVQLNFSTDRMTTKAVLDEEKESEIKSLRIYAYTLGRKVGYFYGSPVPSKILMDIEMIQGGASQDVTFYVVANEAAAVHAGTHAYTLTENTTLAELQAMSFTSIDYSSNGLPMYGTSTHQISSVAVAGDAESLADVPGHEGHIISQTINIPLKRAVAKVGVYFAKSTGTTADVTVDQVTVVQGSAKVRNYLLPQTPEVLQNINASAADVTALTSPVTVTANVDLSGSDDTHTSTDYTEFTHVVSAYTFENPSAAIDWKTPAADGKNLRLRIDYTLGSASHTQYVNMPAIERNCHYVANCLVKGEGQIYVVWEVADWNEGGNWELEFNYPSYQNPVQPTAAYNPSTGNYENPQYGNAEMYYSTTETGAFSVDFQMTAPTGQTWTPTFVGDAGDFTIKVFERGTDTQVSVPVTASDKWYTIKVVPLKADKVGTKVKFVITYLPTWMTAPDMLIINGSDSSIKWTETGASGTTQANGEVIIITQVEPK